MSLQIDGFALVTGAGSGIGRDVALAYAEEGAAGVAFADMNIDAAQATAERSKTFAKNPAYQAVALRVDVTSPESVKEMVKATVEAFGRIDYSVNSAGVGVQAPREIADASLPEFDRFYTVHVRGMLLCVQAVTRAMKLQPARDVPAAARFSTTPSAADGGPRRDIGRGVIINLGSANSFVATPQIVQYTASKHAMLGLTRTAALDNAPHNIRVNAVCPSWVETPMIDAAVAGNPELGKMMARAVPWGRIARTEEVSDVILFMSSPRASYVTGAAWMVDGGTTLQMQT